ncbi:hypothetical protein ES319_D05G175700v1 [Gossypium barbadense]|uniref:Receptor-like serine/threonine-protein kinase n=2 Tax=Gossypium TaxID=3633 RepID=A0A5J5RDQ8_GOSBA|nr:hypothetical protein ES319_D05G175700v1 [Gossypium barbadense]TYG68853.1 hypothetical protein ES288_D05G185400v1 [Gossypium darwinii]
MDTVKWLAKAMLLYQLFHFSFSLSLDAITPHHSLRDGDVVISRGNTFVLGFFSPANSRYRYVGIWHYQVSIQTVVWVANRENPINETSGTLSISSQGNLVLYHKNYTIPLWSTNSTLTHSNNSTARLLDTGNLVLVQNEITYWQSFDYPTNTMLPFMKVGLNLSTGVDRFLTPWKSPNDPGIGNFTYKLDSTGFPQLFLYKGLAKFWRAGSWTGQRWVGIPEMRRSPIFNYSFVYNDEEISASGDIKDASVITRMIANETGEMQRFLWNHQNQRWVTIWSAPKEECDFYGHCGPNSNRDQTQVDKLECSCLPGFEPKSPETWSLRDWSAGCARRANASICKHGEGFVKVAAVKIPDTAVANADMGLGLKQCQRKCLRNCSCMAYASAFSESNGGTGCLTWHGDLLDINTYRDAGQDLFIRVDAVVLGRQRGPSLSSTTNPTHLEDSLNGTSAALPVFNLGTTAVATNNFSPDNRLGQGGFGPVYKIVSGIAGGIVYLHQDSRLRIIHTDLKASNILLDAQMNPKISDFGLAKIFGGDQVEADTKRVVGTYGYMSPEYAMQGHFSIKSDVYSFGVEVSMAGWPGPTARPKYGRVLVLLLEILTGRRNNGHYPDSPTSNLIGHVWELWKNDKAMEIVDSSLGGDLPSAEVLRCLQIGLLCVQESATDRPKMSAVVAMLGNDASLPSPKQPAFFINRSGQGDERGSSQGTGSINIVTLTMPHAR